MTVEQSAAERADSAYSALQHRLDTTGGIACGWCGDGEASVLVRLPFAGDSMQEALAPACASCSDQMAGRPSWRPPGVTSAQFIAHQKRAQAEVQQAMGAAAPGDAMPASRPPF